MKKILYNGFILFCVCCLTACGNRAYLVLYNLSGENLEMTCKISKDAELVLKDSVELRQALSVTAFTIPPAEGIVIGEDGKKWGRDIWRVELLYRDIKVNQKDSLLFYIQPEISSIAIKPICKHYFRYQNAEEIREVCDSIVIKDRGVTISQKQLRSASYSYILID